MSRIKVYDTHTEIINGLFIDTENEKSSFTKNHIGEVLKSVVAGVDLINSSDREIVIYSSREGTRQFNRVVQEEVQRQFTNMLEEEIIQYFDTISQEDE